METQSLIDVEWMMLVWNLDLQMTSIRRCDIDDNNRGYNITWFRLCNSKCLENPATREDCTVVYPARKGHGSIQ